jgi:(S)-citramalyl-CoA lyase
MTGDHDERIRAARSWLYTPGTRPQLFGRARDAGADALVIDLEDAVGRDDKDAARAHAVGHLAAEPTPGTLRAIRINSPTSEVGRRDLEALARCVHHPDAIVVPKCESGAVVTRVIAAMGDAGRDTAVIAMVESARGVVNIADVVSAPRLAGLAVGAADLAADLGGEPSWNALAGIRSTLVVHAAAARVPIIDSPFFAFGDLAGLDAEARAAAAMGFTAKAAIHPRQVGPINLAFSPSAADVAWARRVLSAADPGVGVVDGAMVDEAVARRARRILDVAAHIDV